MSEPLLAEEQHFVDCIQTGRTPTTDGYGMRTENLVGAASHSRGGAYQTIGDWLDVERNPRDAEISESATVGELCFIGAM